MFKSKWLIENDIGLTLQQIIEGCCDLTFSIQGCNGKFYDFLLIKPDRSQIRLENGTPREIIAATYEYPRMGGPYFFIWLEEGQVQQLKPMSLSDVVPIRIKSLQIG